MGLGCSQIAGVKSTSSFDDVGLMLGDNNSVVMQRNPSMAAVGLPEGFHRHGEPPQDNLSQSMSYWEEYSFNNRQSLQQALHAHQEESLSY